MTRGHLYLWALAFLLRLPVALAPPSPTSDAEDFLRLGTSLREGSGYVSASGHPTAFRPPLYPILIATVGGAGLRAVTVVGAALGALTCVFAVWLATPLLGPGRAVWVPGALLAFDPVQIALAGQLFSEALFTPLLLAALLFVRRPSAPSKAALAGALLGLGLLTRTAAAPAIAVVAWWLTCLRPRRLLPAAVLCLSTGIVVAPWVVRNWLVLGAPVITTQGGITLYSSYHPPGGRLFGVLVHDEVVTEALRLGEVKGDRQLTRAALAGAIERPWDSLRLAVLKIAFAWVPVDWEVLKPSGRVAPVFLFGFPFAVVGLLKAPRRFALVGALVGTFTVFSALVYGSPRLRLPYEPLLLIAAVDAARRVPRLLVACWAAAALGLFLLGPEGKELLAVPLRAVGWW